MVNVEVVVLERLGMLRLMNSMKVEDVNACRRSARSNLEYIQATLGV
jgi:hypothetical protein